MNTYTIIAGANGVGKTSLYTILKSSDDLGTRINVDEIVSHSGSWMNKLLQIKASRSALSLANKCISNGQTFHQETTLPGSVVQKQIKNAKAKGFTVRLYYIGVESVEVALERIAKRVKAGGHGIDENTVRKRFDSMPKSLGEILPLCDAASFYDNTLRFRRIALTKGNVVFDCDVDVPKWFVNLEKEGIVRT